MLRNGFPSVIIGSGYKLIQSLNTIKRWSAIISKMLGASWVSSATLTGNDWLIKLFYCKTHTLITGLNPAWHNLEKIFLRMGWNLTGENRA